MHELRTRAKDALLTMEIAREESTAIGAGVGAVGGAVLTGGSAVGTVGGAAVGGLIGNQVGKDKK